MSDTAQLGLREPEQTDWDNYNQGSKYAPPPVPIDSAGNLITFYGMAEGIREDGDDDGYLQFVIDPVKIVLGDGAGQQVRFTYASTRPKMRKDRKSGELVPIKGNPTKLGDYLRACGSPAKPQTNDQYRAAVKVSTGKKFPFKADWYARNKDTGEFVSGYVNFPEDPERPGQKRAILRAGDVVTERDAQGNITGTRTIKSEILFANLRLRYFVDPTRGGGQ